MRVLFVSSGNSVNGISPIVKSQGNSLINQGVKVDFFTIKGKGIKGYLKNIPRLRKIIKAKGYDIVHVHYSKSAFVASLAGAKPLVVSLMGSDIHSTVLERSIIKLFNKLYWCKVIVKSKDMKKKVEIQEPSIIPNGVNFDMFKPISKTESRNYLKWKINEKHILFAANPKRYEKNYKLAKEAFGLLENNNIQIHYLSDVPNEKVVYHINSADVVILTSLWEGSPNVIKEAMACNIPIVSTDVGDVRDVIGNTEGCFITTFKPEDVAEKMQKALEFGKRTTGREDIKHLESGIIAKKIIEIYKSVLTKK